MVEGQIRYVEVLDREDALQSLEDVPYAPPRNER